MQEVDKCEHCAYVLGGEWHLSYLSIWELVERDANVRDLRVEDPTSKATQKRTERDIEAALSLVNVDVQFLHIVGIHEEMEILRVVELVCDISVFQLLLHPLVEPCIWRSNLGGKNPILVDEELDIRATCSPETFGSQEGSHKHTNWSVEQRAVVGQHISKLVLNDWKYL